MLIFIKKNARAIGELNSKLNVNINRYNECTVRTGDMDESVFLKPIRNQVTSAAYFFYWQGARKLHALIYN